MSRKDDVREFLISRRAHVTPEQAGLPDFGGERRVPGLRREEVAMLADVSLDYYTQLERGNIRGASESVLNAIARALRLDDAERRYLFDLARDTPARSARIRKPVLRSSVQRVLNKLAVPAVVYNAQHDLIAANLMGRALFAPQFEAEKPNVARFIFLDPRARDFYHRHKGVSPPRGRRDRDHLRPARATRTARPGHLHLQRRRRLTVCRQARAPCQLGGHPRVRGRP